MKASNGRGRCESRDGKEHKNGMERYLSVATGHAIVLIEQRIDTQNLAAYRYGNCLL